MAFDPNTYLAGPSKFDPDAYLSKDKTFDPDAFLAKTPEPQSLTDSFLKGAVTPPVGFGETKGTLGTIPKLDTYNQAAHPALAALFNPTIGAANKVGEFASGMTAPDQAALAMALGPLSKAAKAGKPFAGAILSAIMAKFSEQGAKGAGEASGKASVTLQDPNATPAQQAEDVTGAVLSAGMAAAPLAGVLASRRAEPPPSIIPAVEQASSSTGAAEANGLANKIATQPPAPAPAPTPQGEDLTGMNQVLEPQPNITSGLGNLATDRLQEQVKAKVARQIPKVEKALENAKTPDAKAAILQNTGVTNLPKDATESASSIEDILSGVENLPKTEAERAAGPKKAQEFLDEAVKGGSATRGVAPVEYLGIQQIENNPSDKDFHLWNLTKDIPGHPEGSTVTSETLKKLGYEVPDPLESLKDQLTKARIDLIGRKPTQPNALQEQSPAEVPVLNPSGDGEAVGASNPVNIRSTGARPPSVAETQRLQEQRNSEDPEVRAGYRKDLIGNIAKLSDKALSSPSVDVEQKANIREAIKAVTDGPVEDLDKVHENTLPTSVLEALHDKVRVAEALGRIKVKGDRATFDAEKEIHTQDMAGSTSEPISGLPQNITKGQRLTTAQKISQTLGNRITSAMDMARNTGRVLLHRDVVQDSLDGNAGYRGFISRVFGGKIDAAFNADHNLRNEWKAPLREIVKAENLDDTSLDRVGIYADLKQGIPEKRLLDSGVPAEVLGKIKSEGLTPGEMRYYAETRKLLDEKILPQLKETMRNIYNVEVTPVKDYFPLQRDYDLVNNPPAKQETAFSSGEQAGLDELAKGIQRDAFTPRTSTKTDQGATIARLEKAKTAIRTNAGDILDAHINDVAHLVTHQRDLRMLGQIARTSAFAKKYGNLGQEWVLNMLDTVARDSSPAGSTRSAWIDYFRKNTSAAILGFRFLSQAKHLPNVAIGMTEIGPDNMINGLRESIGDKGSAFIDKHFQEIAMRQGGEPSIAELAADRKTLLKKAVSASFWFERKIDSTIAKASVLGAYMKELKAKGLDPSRYAELPFDKEAGRMALVNSRKVITSPLLKDIPHAISRGSLTGKNMSAAGALFQFQNTMLRQTGYLKHDIYDLGVKGLNGDQFLKASTGFLLMLAAETAIVKANQKLLGKAPAKNQEEKGFAEDAALELLKRVPFAGNAYAAYNRGETGAVRLARLRLRKPAWISRIRFWERA